MYKLADAVAGSSHTRAEERRPQRGDGATHSLDAALPWPRLAIDTPTPRAGTTTPKAGSVDHAQAPISFSTLFMCDQFLMSGTE